MKPSEALTFKRPLLQHQKDALDRFAFEPECGLFWEMGTMKTTTAIAWLRAKYNLAKDVTRTLIISPVATLYGWRNEFLESSPERVQNSILIPYMKTDRGKFKCDERASEIEKTDKRIIILNADSLDSDSVVAALIKFKPVNVVIDEIHKFKSPKMFAGDTKKRNPSRLSKLIDIVAGSDNRMGLTGTPILNGYLDLWSQMLLIDKGKSFGNNFFVFRETYFKDENAGWKTKPGYFPHYVPKPGIEAILSQILEKKVSRLTKDTCLDLPDQVFETYGVELGVDQAKAYSGMLRDLVAEVDGGVCAAMNALSKINRLLQILAGHLPVEFEDDSEKVLAYFKSNPRMDALKSLLSDIAPRHKVVVWAGYKATYPKLRGAFKDLGFNHAELVGNTKDRQGELDRFQYDPKCRIMMSHPAAGGVGVNGMQVASYSIGYAHSHNLGDRLQSLARTHRGGSEIHDRITHIDLVASGTIEEDVLACLGKKEQFSTNVLDRIKNRC